MSKTLTAADYARAAADLNCEVAAIKAVTEVEAPRGGFLPDGRPTILFERHKFHRYTAGRFSSSNPDISSSKPGGYGPAGAHQWARFSRAFQLDPKAAMMSTSWGKFQVMGFNFQAAGFPSVDAMVEAMKESEGRQLDAFVAVVKAWGLADELRRHDWARFASAYNGENYRINQYDTKLAASYRRHLRDSGGEPAAAAEALTGHSVADLIEPVEETVPAEPPPTETAEAAPAPAVIPTAALPPPQEAAPSAVIEHADAVKVESNTPVPGGGVDDAPVQASQGGNKSMLATAVGVIGGGLTGVGGFLMSDRGMIIMGVAGALLLLLALIFRQVLLDYLRMKLFSDPHRINVK